MVDTPGLFDTALHSEIIKLEILQCINLTFPGPHLFLFVFGVGRFTSEENEALEQLFNIFGEGFYNYACLVLSRIDDLERNGTSVEEFIESSSDGLKNALQKCNGRYIAINNHLQDEKS